VDATGPGRTYRDRVEPRRPRLTDLALAAAVVAAGLAEVWVPFSSVQGDGSRTATSVAIVVSGIALSQRRRHPLAAQLVVSFGWFAMMAVSSTLVTFFGQFVPLGIAVFTTARHGRAREPYLGAAAAALCLLCVDLFVPELRSPGEMVFHWGAITIVWLLGYRLSRLEERSRESTRRAIDAEVTAAERAMAAVVEERTRIARELHDIVAHSVTSMVVQAGAAEQVVADDPEYVRRALATIRTTGSEALADMRRVVAMLRDADEPGALAPQPGVQSLPALVDDARAAGLSASLDVVGTVRPLPAGVDVAAYRIVQEALTNVRRHAHASSVRVGLHYSDDAIRIEVADDGVGAHDLRGGHGLVGMRERASLYGGGLDAGSENGCGFVVRAVLPAAAT
jgi:signal transduction histidine kinase